MSNHITHILIDRQTWDYHTPSISQLVVRELLDIEEAPNLRREEEEDDGSGPPIWKGDHLMGTISGGI